MLEPANIVDACNQMIGSLGELADRAEAELPPTVEVAEMHPAVWGQAARLWRDGHYRQAVSAAADGVVGLVKSRTGRRDIEDTSQWQQAFSKDDPEPGKPRLRWPGDQTDKTVISMNSGLRQFAPGAQLTIRNPATHGPGELAEQEAVQRLSVLSLNRLASEGIADKELSELLARDQLIPVVHETTYEELREVSPLLGSRSATEHGRGFDGGHRHENCRVGPRSRTP